MATTTEILNNYDMFLKIQNNLDTEALQQIFGDDYEHYESKWQNAEYNLLYFINRLDHINKEKVITWGKNITNHSPHPVK